MAYSEASTSLDMNRYWWITLLPVGWTKEESAAGVRLYVAALTVFLGIAIPLGKLVKKFAIATDLGLSLLFLSLIPAFLLARTIVAFVSSDVLKAGDEANAKRIAARTNVD